jgi:hypothetical protein
MPTEVQTLYFNQPGHENTDDTLRLARTRADQLGIRDIVVASSTGATGVKACQHFTGYNLVVVAGAVGYPDPNESRMQTAHRTTLEAHGAKVLFAGHAFGMLGRAVNKKFGAIQLDEVIAHTLRVVGAGVKVGCEIVCMATDAGLIRAGQDVIAIGGSERGADTAVVIKASNTHRFFDTRVREIICKPRD